MSSELGEVWERYNEEAKNSALRYQERLKHEAELRTRVKSAASFAKEILERIGYSVLSQGRFGVEYTMQSDYIPLGGLPEVNGRAETDSFVQLTVIFRKDRQEIEKTRKGWFFSHIYTEVELVPNFDFPSGVEVDYFAGTEDRSTMTYFGSNRWSITSPTDEEAIRGVETALPYINEITQPQIA
jgi:hypothetical protein